MSIVNSFVMLFRELQCKHNVFSVILRGNFQGSNYEFQKKNSILKTVKNKGNICESTQ